MLKKKRSIMSRTKTITLDEVKNLPPLSEKRTKSIENLPVTYDEENPPLSEKQLQNLRPAVLFHPEWFRPRKADVHIKIDVDVLEAFKAQGKGYQTRINEVLRNYIFCGTENR